jgi:sigma-B regulation protein RsbU (phosphoserine phosphatase)
VSDKGVPAALFMAVTKTLLKGMSEPGQRPHELLQKVNREVAEANDLNMFVTIFCAKLDFATGELWYSNAGHNPPLLLRKGQRPEWLPLPPGLVLGALPGSTFRTDRILLNPGDALFTYTDGVTEAMDPEAAMFTEERLASTLKPLAGAGPKELVEAVGTAVKAFAAGAPQSDDVTMLALKYRGKA